MKISQSQVVHLWIESKKNGYSTSAVREVLKEYGLASTKDITDHIYEGIKMKLSSRVLAKRYNALVQKENEA